MVAIWDSRLPVSLGRLDQSAGELLNPGIIGVAVEISLVTSQETRSFKPFSG